jgi:hypothetical protein
MTQSSTDLIGLVGRRGSGKDFVAAVLLERGYANIKFAGGLKAMIATLLAYQGVDVETIERMIEGDLKEVPSNHLCGKTPRHAMQSLGTEWGRDLIGENLWVDATIAKLSTLPNAVVTDCRFQNELEAIQAIGGTTIRINSVGDNINENDVHESETNVDLLRVDSEFYNDKRIGVETSRKCFSDFIETISGRDT